MATKFIIGVLVILIGLIAWRLYNIEVCDDAIKQEMSNVPRTIKLNPQLDLTARHCYAVAVSEPIQIY